MPTDPVQRRLAAILAADVAGYSRLMGEDEEGTLAGLTAHRVDLIEPAIARHRGRLVKTTGDGLLAEFASVVDAVACAAAIQQGMRDRNANLSVGPRIEWRIGVNLGDIIVQDGDVFGDGVNIAARLEGEATPGEVYVSGSVHEQVAGKLPLGFEDLGHRQVKNIARPLRIFRVRDGLIGSVAVLPAPALPDKPSIAVLPFENMSGDPEQDYFSDGISEDIITDLSKISGLFVIARNSSFAYKGRHVNVGEIGRTLGVRHVLEGSVRKGGRRVRVTAQLIDCASGGHLWAERYDRDLDDIFTVQDELTREIVAALALRLTPDEQTRIAGRGTADFSAYDLYLRGRELVWSHLRPQVLEGQALLRRAIAQDPNFAAAHALLGFGCLLEYINGWVPDYPWSLKLALDLTGKAVGLAPDDAIVRWAFAVACLWNREHDRAIAEARACIALEESSAFGHVILGQALCYAGRGEEGLAALETATRLNPFSVDLVVFFRAQALLSLRRYADAAAALEERLPHAPLSEGIRVLLASCYGHLGRPEEGRACWAEALRLCPDYSVAHRREVLPYRDPAQFEDIVDGLRKAGVAV